MNNRLQELLGPFNKKRNVGIIILAALLLVVILFIQYAYTRSLFEREMERQAESELTMKAILVKGMLNQIEGDLRNHMWSIENTLDTPDSLLATAERLVADNPYLMGGGIAFMPDYYPQKGRLFEPYALETDTGIVMRQIAGPGHDYTQMEFFKRTTASGKPQWSDPYVDTVGAGKLICSYTLPVHDRNGTMVGVFGTDVALDWLSDTINVRQSHPSSFCMLLTDDCKPIVLPTPRQKRWRDGEQVARMIADSTARRDSSRTGRTVLFEFESDVDGSDGYVFYANLRGKPHWKIATVCYDVEVYDKLYWMSLNILVLIFVALGVLAYIIRRAALGERRLQVARIEQERLGGELRIASAIQQAMLPQADRAEAAARIDVDVASALTPAREVGGDLYDYFIRDEKLFFCIGDVSGKGIPAALVMAVIQVLFHTVSRNDSQPAHIMGDMNQTLCHNNERNMFITMFIGVLDLPTGRLRYCNAGHNPPVILIDGEARLLPVEANLPLAVMGDFRYEMQETQLPAGATLFLYTDGLTEAMDAQHQLFGTEAMLATLSRHGQQEYTSQHLLTTLADEVHRFVQDAEPSDDLTMLAIRYTPPIYHEVLDEKLALTNDLKHIPRLNAFIDEVSQRVQLPSALGQQMKLAVEEAVVNVMEYAYPQGTQGEVLVEAKSNGKRLKFIITDAGTPFDPTAAPPADTTLTVEERPIGGLGIFLVRQLMDSINYERIDGKNVLTLRKDLPKELIMDN